MHAELDLRKISRSKGQSSVGASAYRSAVACAAYRSGEKLSDQRYDKTYDYTNKENVLHSEIITPEHAPEWMKDRQQLWNGIEAKERRKDALLAKEALLILPRNMSDEQHLDVVRKFVGDNITSRDLIADFAIHSSDASDGLKNPHAHVMFTLRPVEGDGFGKKLTGMKDGLLDSKQFLREIRQSYEDVLNEVSTDDGENAIIYDLRSNKDKGIDREPQPKIGAKVTALEKRGYETVWGREVRQKAHQRNPKTPPPVQPHRPSQRQHVNSYQLIGGGSQQRAFAWEYARADIARKYYEVAYGYEASLEDWQKDEIGWYGR